MGFQQVRKAGMSTMSTAIQVAVARADLAICQIAALPWRRIGLSFLISAIVVWVVKAALREGGDKVEKER